VNPTGYLTWLVFSVFCAFARGWIFVAAERHGVHTRAWLSATAWGGAPADELRSDPRLPVM
jgi:hypothetical protein